MKKTHIILLMATIFMSYQAMAQSGQTAKKVFKLNLTGGLTSLDPAFADQRTNIWAVTQLYNGLFSFSEDLHVRPELAENYDISEDGLTYTFKIKEKVFFHDDPAFKNGQGREVTAADFIYSFKRLLDPRTAAKGSWIFTDKVKRNTNGKIADDWITQVDKYKFKIMLARRFPAFLQILAMPFTMVIPKEAVEKYGRDFRRHPVGTGPFMLKSWNEAFLLQKKSSTKPGLLLVKNPKYWKRDIRNRSLPYLDAVAVSLIQDKDQVFRNFEQGKLDFINSLSAASRRKVLNKDGSIRQVFKNKYVVKKRPYMITEYIGFLLEGTDQKTNPLLNVKVRKALSYAINRKTLVSVTNEGLGIPGNHGFVPVAIASYDSTFVNGYNFNPQKAQQLLKEAGYPQGKGFPNITLNTYNTDKALCELLQKQWQQHLGIKVKLKAQSYVEHKNKVDNGQVKFFRGAWIGDYPDAENFLAMFYSKFVAPEGPNKTRFNNPAFDKLFIESQETDNTFTRYDNYHAMDQLIVDKAPVIVLYYGEVLNLKQKNIIGLKTNTMNTMVLEKADIKDK